MAEMLNKIPPRSLEAEQATLGAMVIEPDAIPIAAELVRAEDFYIEGHQIIFRAILSMHDRGEPVDIITLDGELRRLDKLEKVGGIGYLTTILNTVPTAANVHYYAKTVAEKGVLRDIIRAGTRIAELGYKEDSDSIDSIVDGAERLIFQIGQRRKSQDFVHMGSVMKESFKKVEQLYHNKSYITGLPSGFLDLDRLTAGFQPGDLIVIAARPGMGKTAFALNIAQYAAAHANLAVGIFSLEMSKEELVDRLIVSEADIDAWRLKTGNLKEADFSKISDAMGRLGDAPLFIDDTPGIGIMEMRTKARRLQSEHGVKLIVVDYLQLVVANRQHENRVQEVSEVSQSLKNLARELKIPVLALSQLSRAVESRGTKEPQLADLRESGAIEQDADVVMFLYRPDDENLEQVALKIAKHRNGALRNVNLMFRGDRVKFFGMEKKRE